MVWGGLGVEEGEGVGDKRLPWALRCGAVNPEWHPHPQEAPAGHSCSSPGREKVPWGPCGWEAEGAGEVGVGIGHR